THVGMDRPLLQPQGPPPAEPHARGDGPVGRGTPFTHATRAPRTWGWTGVQQHPVGGGRPSPTHVGMDRRSKRTWRRSGAEPHARGDGPRAVAQRAGGGGRAPRTWGWTDSEPRTYRIVFPSPTHVGMDRPSA